MTLLLLAASLTVPPCANVAGGGAVVEVRVSRPATRPVGPFDVRGEEVLAEQFGVVLTGPSGDPVVLTTFRAAAFAPTANELRDRGRAPGDVRAFVRLPGGRSFPAGVLAADAHSGLATFEFTTSHPPLSTVRLSAAAVEPDDVLCLPLGEGQAGTARTIAAIGLSYPAAAAGTGAGWSRDDPGPGVLHAFGTLTELAPPPPPGSSGRGVFTEEGELVGLLVEPNDGEALPPRMVPLTGAFRRIMDGLAAGEPVGYGLLGVEPATITADATFAVLGEQAPPGAALLDDVRGSSPAEAAGLGRGDWIVGFTDPDGIAAPVRSAADLVRLVALSPPGAKVSLEAITPRTGERRTATVTLAAAATGRAAGGWPAVHSVPRGIAVRSVRVDWPTAAALVPPGEPLPTGAFVILVDDEAQPADSSIVRPLRVGDRVVAVNGETIGSPMEFAAAVAEATGPVSVRLSDGAAAVLP
ncbi:trypsin-like peptidase domain-containing protein [Alienimonas chondri]|uniref:PDZ domain-containing protein n=1 Tax=Alienimonas chondri TaxID=2681879 RepID=A0ABX1VGM6_9PLAN|nr:trypsin-like peptidase domain-containing protein [Alienimonas chondri]NNJ25936.1 hypothetical protein [Alienimonas chondri]